MGAVWDGDAFEDSEIVTIRRRSFPFCVIAAGFARHAHDVDVSEPSLREIFFNDDTMRADLDFGGREESAGGLMRSGGGGAMTTAAAGGGGGGGEGGGGGGGHRC